MADLASASEVRGDLLKVKLGADDIWFLAEVKYEIAVKTADAIVLRYGQTPIGRRIMGFMVTFEMTFRQTNAAMIKRAISATAGPPSKQPAVGTEPAESPLTFHDPADLDATTTNDLYFPRVTFEGLGREADGEGMADFTVKGIAMLDVATDTLYRVGAAA